MDRFQKDGTLDRIFSYKNPFLVLSLYSKAVLAHSQQSAVIILYAGLAIANQEFLPKKEVDPLEEESIQQFCNNLFPLKLWFRELEHKSHFFEN